MPHIWNLKNSVYFLLFAVLALSACKTQPSNSALSSDDNGGYAGDASKIEWINNDIISLADAAGKNYNGAYMRRASTIGVCATVATDTLNSPNQLIIRFGDTYDCTCLDGRKRKGNIIINYSGRYTDSGQLHIISFDNYFIDGLQITGSIQVVRVDTTVVGDWYYKVTVNDSMLITPDQYVVWKGTLVRKWVAGFLDEDRSNDVFSISGNTTLTRPNTHRFTFDIATPLQFALNCNYAESGVVNVASLDVDGVTRVLNYGVGTCDNLVQENIGVNSYQVKLP